MAAPRAMVPPDLIDTDGNLRAADIGITWQGSETFLHGVKVVGPRTVGIAIAPATGDVDAIHTGAGTCPLSQVVTTTYSSIVRGVARSTCSPAITR